jgi:transcription termination factor Rho
MPVLDRSELEASPLADLHAIANELGVDGFRLLPREDLIDAILGDATDLTARDLRPPDAEPAEPAAPSARSRSSATGRRRTSERRSTRRTSTRSQETTQRADREHAEGVVEVRENGSAFLRVHPPGPSDDDVYISPAQVKRCELTSGDKVSGPVRRARRSERHPSLARVEAVNGEPAEGAAADGRARGTAAPAAGPSFPSEPLTFGSDDATLRAIEKLAPLGHGSRAVIVGASRAGKTELLRRMLEALARRRELDVSLVLVGVRPEEIAEWEAGPVKPAAAISFAGSPDAQGQALEQVLQKAERAASGGRQAVVLVDTLDGLHPHTARKVLASAHKFSGRSRRGAEGSLTVIGTATRPYGGETTVVALDVALASSGKFPAIDVMASGTLRPELLVGEEGAREIMRAHAASAPKPRGWRRLFGG